MYRLIRFAAFAFAAFAILASCESSPTLPPSERGPQTIVLFSTPKAIRDFESPAADVRRFLEHYAPLTGPADSVIVIFAVGNSEHVLTYKGPNRWADTVVWARYTGVERVDYRPLNYTHIANIVATFRAVGDSMGIPVKVFDQVDGGVEFGREYFKLNYHPECFSKEYDSYDIRGVLGKDYEPYAAAPHGIVPGTNCGVFLVDQIGHYVRDLDFDGMLYGNQLGTRGRWQPDAGPGYSAAEAQAIREFFAYTKTVLGDRQLIWFDSYNNTRIEREVYSVPPDAYEHMDYILAAGFCVITFRERYVENLLSKIRLRPSTKVLATLDYVDPWYDYKSMEDFPACSTYNEDYAIQYQRWIDGVVFFANDHEGKPVPRARIESFARRFFAD